MTEVVKYNKPFEQGHWLNPFAERITSISVSDDEIEVVIHTNMDEFTMDVKDPNEVWKLGINTVRIERPTRRLQFSLYDTRLQATGEIIITLTLDRNKNQLNLIR